MKRLAIIIAGAALLVLGFSAASLATKPPAPPGQDPCSHGRTDKPCRPDPQPGHGKDCEHHGNSGGVNEDHCASTTTTTTTQSSTTSTSRSTTTQSASTSSVSFTTQGNTTTPAPIARPHKPSITKPPKTKTPSGGAALPGHKPKVRMFHGKPHAIIRGSG